MIDKAIRHQINIQRYGASNVKRAEVVLREALRRIDARLAAYGDAKTLTVKQYRALRSEVEALMIGAAGDVQSDLFRDLSSFAKYEADFTVGMLSGAVTVRIAATATELAAAAVMRERFKLAESGEVMTVDSAVAQFYKKTATAINTRIGSGLVGGETLPQIAAGVRDLAKGRTLQQSETLVRTITNHVGDLARSRVYADNARLLSGERFVATLDLRTTQGCAALHLKEYAVGKGPRTPRHWNCRSVRVPVVAKEYRLTSDDGDIGARGANGSEPIAANTTFGAWLKRQPVSFQREFFDKFPDGGAKFELFSKGGLPLDRFADAKGAAYTLDELVKLDPVAAQKAGV